MFGVPQTLFCNLGRQYANQVIQSVTREWAGEVEIEVGTQKVPNYALEQANNELEEMVADRVQEKPLWTQWLSFVQCESSLLYLQ